MRCVNVSHRVCRFPAVTHALVQRNFGSSQYLEAYRRTHCPEALEVDKARGVTIP